MILETTNNLEYVPDSSILTVSDLNSNLKMIINTDPYFRNVFVKGEIRNFSVKNKKCFFTLKDPQSIVKCICFFEDAALYEGAEIVVRGNLEVYSRNGSYNILVDEVFLTGEGALYKKFLLLKEKLEKKGYFSSHKKKILPGYPEKIGIVTSRSGAVIHDMTKMLAARYPYVHVSVCDVRVQGEKSPDEIINALKKLEGKTDFVIVARGGGSVEDLWNFNDERLVEFVHSYSTPLVSAIGHETDFTLLDFVADLRAPTPSSAIEMCFPDKNYLKRKIQGHKDYLSVCLRSKVKDYSKKLRHVKDRLTFLHQSNITKKRYGLNMLKAELESLNPNSILKKGYSLVLQNENVVTSSKKLRRGSFTLVFNDGEIICEVKK